MLHRDNLGPQDLELQDPELQDPELQDPELQDPELQDLEPQGGQSLIYLHNPLESITSKRTP
jgi:hypothetical protein